MAKLMLEMKDDRKERHFQRFLKIKNGFEKERSFLDKTKKFIISGEEFYSFMQEKQNLWECNEIPLKFVFKSIWVEVVSYINFEQQYLETSPNNYISGIGYEKN